MTRIECSYICGFYIIYIILYIFFAWFKLYICCKRENREMIESYYFFRRSPKACSWGAARGRVARFGLKKQICLFKSVGLEFLKNLLSSWPFFKPIGVYIVNSKIFPFLKQEFGISQLQSSGNPGTWLFCRALVVSFLGFIFCHPLWMIKGNRGTAQERPNALQEPEPCS